MIRDGFEQENFFFLLQEKFSCWVWAGGFVSRSRGYHTAIYCRQYCTRTGTALSSKVKFEAERGEEATECKKGAREVI